MLSDQRGRVFFSVLALLSFLIVFAVSYSQVQMSSISYSPEQELLGTFSSSEELSRFVKLGTGKSFLGGIGVQVGDSKTYNLGGPVVWDTPLDASSWSLTESSAMLNSGNRWGDVTYRIGTSTDVDDKSKDFSTTNVQVAGVDEADIVKTDGKYIYCVSEDKVFIVRAYPPENSGILSVIEPEGGLEDIFINGDRLAIMGHSTLPQSTNIKSGLTYISYLDLSARKTFVEVYDISDRKNPKELKRISLEGKYFDSRMIGKFVYLIVNKPVKSENVDPPHICVDNNKTKVIPASEVRYFDSFSQSYRFMTVLSINLEDPKEFSKKAYLTGRAQNIYVSKNNIYVTARKQNGSVVKSELLEEVVRPSLPKDLNWIIERIRHSSLSFPQKWIEIENRLAAYLGSLKENEKERLLDNIHDRAMSFYKKIRNGLEKTIIHKISIEKGKVEYMAWGEVPGRVLNQFSMDEYEGYFRIATTTGRVWNESSQNHVYILNQELEITGRLENLAPTERIYSARFMGERAYLVTFKKVDPLFVLNLGNPADPKVLGKLKIPGYSNYLHPWDENHLIGVGKSTVAAGGGDFAWYQGVKVSIFDVSDLDNPKETSKFVIGDRGTESLALREHKAFLFNRSKNLLVIPVKLAEIDEDKYSKEVSPFARGEYVWQGAYAFNLDSEDGIALKGRISHLDSDEDLSGSGYYNSPYSVKRSLYIENVLYTFSEKKLKMNDLGTLSEIGEIDFGYEHDSPKVENLPKLISVGNRSLKGPSAS